MVELATGVSLPHAIVEAVTGGPLPVGRPPPAGGGAAVRFLVAAPGRVTAVSGVAEALGVPGVLRVGDLCRPGDAVPPLSDSHGRVGHVLAAGADAERAAAAADRAVALITVDTVGDTGATAPTATPAAGAR
jgi:biotin carboxylase